MRQIEIVVDYNDGNYETIRKEISDEELNYFNSLFQAISAKGTWHNWVQNELESELGLLKDMYPNISEKVLDKFDEILLFGCSDYCCGWIHTIRSIQILEVTVIEKLV
jgi:hypothetical protein